MFALFVFIITFSIQLYLGVPTLNFGYVGIIFVTLLSLAFACGASVVLATIKEEENPRAPIVIGAIGATILFLFLGVSFFTTSSIVHSTEYRDLLGKVTEVKYNKDLPPIDISNAPLVSEHMALQVAQKKLSEIPALGSQVTLGKFTKQAIRGKLYWVAFLEHSGFFKWNSTGFTPGYIKVSATNIDDAQLVTEINHKPLKMRYLDSAYFGDDAERKIYFGGNMTYGITELSTELDDDGNPFIVASLYYPTVGFSGNDVIGVAILDVQTGVVSNYGLNNIPAWVDRVYPQKFVESQINDWGKYIHGWMNLSDNGRLQTSGDLDLVYGSDGFCYFYAGITSVGNDNGIIGFMLVNSRTKESKVYMVAGADESVASKAAVDVIPEKHYHATNPLPFTVDDVPTYIMTLTDENGIPRAYGMVSIANYQTLAVSDSLKSTLRLYETKLAAKGATPTGTNLDVKSTLEPLSGKVLRFASDTRQGSTSYYLTIEGNHHIFTANSDVSEKIVLTRPGDHVSIQYTKSESKISTINVFDNTDIQ
jgi:hypothetical protein